MRVVILAGHSALKTRVNALVMALAVGAGLSIGAAPAQAQDLPWGRGPWCLQATGFPNCSYPSHEMCRAAALGVFRSWSCFPNPYLAESRESRPSRAPRRGY